MTYKQYDLVELIDGRRAIILDILETPPGYVVEFEGAELLPEGEDFFTAVDPKEVKRLIESDEEARRRIEKSTKQQG